MQAEWFHFIYSYSGLCVGGITDIAGIWLLFAKRSHLTKRTVIGWGSLKVENATPGISLVVVGTAIIFITRLP